MSWLIFRTRSLIRWDQPGQTFEVTPGQSEALTFNLKLGQLQVEVDDELASRSMAPGIFAYAYPSTEPHQRICLLVRRQPHRPAPAGRRQLSHQLILEDRPGTRLDRPAGAGGRVKQVTVNPSNFK